jgi:hypothetical protein
MRVGCRISVASMVAGSIAIPMRNIKMAPNISLARLTINDRVTWR